MAARDDAKETKTLIASNRKARHDYDLIDRFEAGLVLRGTEVKSLRDGKCDLTSAYATCERGELFLHGAEIAEYSHGNLLNHAPKSVRKLLLHRREIKKIQAALKTKTLTLVPLEMYFLRGFAKVEIALARGRKEFDKREAKAKKEVAREIARATGRRGR